MHWRNAHVGKQGDRFAIGGVPVWQQQWRWPESRTVRLPDPLDPSQMQTYMVCEIGNSRQPVRFAACKLDSGLWSFYVPD